MALVAVIDWRAQGNVGNGRTDVERPGVVTPRRIPLGHAQDRQAFIRHDYQDIYQGRQHDPV